MIKIILYIRADLRNQITTLCAHLRRGSFPKPSSSLQDALQNMIYFQLLEDELSILLSRREIVIDAMEKFQTGEPFGRITETEEGTIYQYCLAQFDPKADCPLGSATDDLRRWVSTHADRQQASRNASDSYYPTTDFILVDKSQEDEQRRALTEAELFDSNARRFLHDIEVSNVLENFTEFMRQVQQQLIAEMPIERILATIKATT